MRAQHAENPWVEGLRPRLVKPGRTGSGERLSKQAEVKEQGQLDETRALIRGNRERALRRIRSEGRDPVFPVEPVERAANEPEGSAPPAREVEPLPAHRETQKAALRDLAQEERVAAARRSD